MAGKNERVVTVERDVSELHRSRGEIGMIKRNSFKEEKAKRGSGKQLAGVLCAWSRRQSQRLGYIVNAFASTEATKAFDNANFSRISSRC